MAGKNQAKKWAVPVLAAACLLCLAMMAAALVYTQSTSQGEFTPPPFDASAVSGTPEVPEELGWQELDAQAFRVSVCGAVVSEGSQADVWLTNPESNTVCGEYVQSVTFDTVPASGAEISMKVMAYEPETYHSAGAVTLNTTIQSGG